MIFTYQTIEGIRYAIANGNDGYMYYTTAYNADGNGKNLPFGMATECIMSHCTDLRAFAPDLKIIARDSIAPLDDDCTIEDCHYQNIEHLLEMIEEATNKVEEVIEAPPPRKTWAWHGLPARFRLDALSIGRRAARREQLVHDHQEAARRTGITYNAIRSIRAMDATLHQDNYIDPVPEEVYALCAAIKPDTHNRDLVLAMAAYEFGLTDSL